MSRYLMSQNVLTTMFLLHISLSLTFDCVEVSFAIVFTMFSLGTVSTAMLGFYSVVTSLSVDACIGILISYPSSSVYVDDL